MTLPTIMCIKNATAIVVLGSIVDQYHINNYIMPYDPASQTALPKLKGGKNIIMHLLYEPVQEMYTLYYYHPLICTKECHQI